MSKCYDVRLTNSEESCLFDSCDGFETFEDALRWGLGRGYRYTIEISDRNKKFRDDEFPRGEVFRVTSRGMLKYQCDGWGIEWEIIKPDDIHKFCARFDK